MGGRWLRASETAAEYVAGAASQPRFRSPACDFKDLRWGHEGPDYFTSKRAPKRDAREIAEARVYGQEAIGMIRFELIDEAGQLLAVAQAVRTWQRSGRRRVFPARDGAGAGRSVFASAAAM